MVLWRDEAYADTNGFVPDGNLGVGEHCTEPRDCLAPLRQRVSPGRVARSDDETTESEMSGTDGGSDTGTDTGDEEPDPCPNPSEPSGCPSPSDFGTFTAHLGPLLLNYHYDETCTIDFISATEPPVVHFDCVVPDDLMWAPQTLEIVVDPKWTPPPVGTKLRLRLYHTVWDGAGGWWTSWRLDLLESGTLVAAMITDVAGGSPWTYVEWGLATEIIWDGCVDVCDELHPLWMHMAIGGESVNMFPGDRCLLGNYQIWLQEAWGYDCDGHVLLLYEGTDVLVLNTSFGP